MSITPIDLSALDAFEGFSAEASNGKPLLLDLAIIHEDPDQPRKAFDDILELAGSIAEVGVKVPISVRPHPTIPGHYMVKFGARRRRAALSAGLAQIPAWIDHVPSDFEQVIENLQRAALTPMELAMFIADKQAGGMKVGEIAQKLGIHRSTISKHLALVNMPPEIEAVYESGRNTSPETIFELRTLFTRYPDQTRAWLARDIEVSRRSVDALKQALSCDAAVNPVPGSAPKAPPARVRGSEDPAGIKRPVVAVKVGERYGIVVLNRRANADDHILIKWDDTAEVDQVPCHDVHLLRVDDARRYEPLNRGLTGIGQTEGSPTAKPSTRA